MARNTLRVWKQRACWRMQSDGGPDTLENTAVLCRRCHREWHHDFEGGPIAFADFLKLPPAWWLYFYVLHESTQNSTVERLRAIWQVMRLDRALKASEIAS